MQVQILARAGHNDDNFVEVTMLSNCQVCLIINLAQKKETQFLVGSLPEECPTIVTRNRTFVIKSYLCNDR
jgi:hypothetical protein